jgi:hypothetical protein
MNNDEKYDLIFNSLLNGTVEDWKRLARQFPDFPYGLDSEPFEYGDGQIWQLGEHWIINAIDNGTIECAKWMISKSVNLRFGRAESADG